MRPLIAVLALLSSSAIVAAQEARVPPADRAAIEAVITGQIEAFRRDDEAAAFAFASPGIRAMFGTPERFMEIVRGQYAPVYRPRQVEFAEAETKDGEVVQAVEVVGPDGSAHRALYTMERGRDGEWRIAGCTLLRSQRLGA